MSANPNNPGLELAKGSSNKSNQLHEASKAASGRDALQALLAFSSLHEQLRQRRAAGKEAEGSARLDADDPWKVEQFVLDDVLHLVAERAMAITGADGVAIAFAEGDAIVCRASVGKIVPDAGVRLDPNSAFSGACFRTGSVVRCDDAENDTRVSVQACRRLGALSIVAVPLVGRTSVLGLIEAFSTEVRTFDDSDIRTLKLLAELILAAIKPEDEDRLAEISRNVVAHGGHAEKKVDPVRAANPLTPSESPIVPRQQENPNQDQDIAILAATNPQTYKRSISAAFIVALLVLAAALVGGLVWLRMQNNRVPAAEKAPAPVVIAQNNSQPGTNNVAAKDSDPVAAGPAAPYPVSGETGTVTGLRHWSSQNSSTIVIDLQKPVQYEAHRINNPDRIYFDLDDTSLVASLSGKVVDINDAFLQRIRVAQPTKGVTRVVLETKSTPNFSVSLEQNPYRLVVEVRKAETQMPTRSQTDLFAPVAPPVESGKAENSAPATVPQAAAHAAKFRIVLDAGHGGWDLGTVGRHGLLEKDLVLDIVNRLGKLVESRLGAEVIYTRSDDTYISLEKRAEIANLSHADFFLSIHANYSSLASARGVETYYTNTYSSVHARTSDSDNTPALTSVDWTNVDIREKVQESRKFAETLQHSLYGTLAEQNPELRDRGVKEASYVVLTGTTMPAILTEVSFISSPADEHNLESAAYRQKIAQALYRGVAHYAEISHRDQLAGLPGRSEAR
jgi:N-acetylmuramoyl-L-alanine amidase/putative methionine-R-sulfoxide reductase with GAF domain